MKTPPSHLLRPSIPFSCSLSRDHEVPGAPDCQVTVGFTPAWFRQHIPLDYGIRWHTDPLHRRRSFVQMAETLNRVFPELRLGGNPWEITGSISQIQTCAFMAALFDREILYYSDNWPVNPPRSLSADEVENLEAPSFQTTPVFEDLMRQMEIIEKEWGSVPGELNYQGVLNTAFRLRGEEIFVDMVERPAPAHHLLNVVCDTMIRVIDAVHTRQRQSGVNKNAFVTANCVVNMISSEMYREYVMPYDKRLSDHFELFGIHNCAWRVDPYAQAYSEIRALGYLDFGLDSDLAMLKRAFPCTTLSAMYSPVDLARKSVEDIRADLARLYDSIGRCKIIVADIEAGTPNQRIRDFYRLVSNIWNIPPEALVPQQLSIR